MTQPTLTLADAIRMARGCHDYGGGYRDAATIEAFHHGISTVVNVLEAAADQGFKDAQVLNVWRIGKAEEVKP